MKSRAQVQGQIFIYILSLIIVSLVLLYGYNAIQDFRNKAEEVSLINFKNELEKAIVKSTRSDDIKPVELSLTGRYQKVCFVDSFSPLSDFDKENTCLCNPSVCTQGLHTDAVICDAWKTTTASNVFLVPMSDIPINIGPITVDGNNDGSEDTACSSDECYLCVSTKTGKIKLILYGKGDHVFIKPR